jgi:Na+(H+)/acetate symporter ActP
MGLEKPLFELKNPGMISIPLGFLGVIFGSLLLRDRRAEDRCGTRCTRGRTPACWCPSPSRLSRRAVF